MLPAAAFWINLGKAVHMGDDGQSRKFGEGEDVPLIAQRRVSILEQSCKEKSYRQASRKSSNSEERTVRKGRRVRKICCVHYGELLALLPAFKCGCHGRFVHFCKQGVIELQGGLMVARDLLELLLDHRAGLNPSLVGANLLPDRCLFLLCFGQGKLRCAKLRFELLQLWRVSIADGGCRSRCWGGRRDRDSRDLCLQISNLSIHRNHVGMVRSVESFQFLLLRHEGFDLRPSVIHGNACSWFSPLVMRLLRDHCVEESHSLLRAANRLVCGIELGGTRLERIRI